MRPYASHLCFRASAIFGGPMSSFILQHQRWSTADEIAWISSKIRTDEDLSRILAAARRRSDWGEMHGREIIAHLEGRLEARRRAILAGVLRSAVLS